MTSKDGEEVLQFVRSLPEEDLFYLMDDIRDPGGMKRWIDGIGDHTIISVLAERPGGLLGYGTLRCGPVQWTRHLGEVRIMVSPGERDKGLGKLLAKDLSDAARDIGLRRIIVRLSSKQTAARYLFQRLGFHIEAVLADCVIDNQGYTQDLIFMSFDMNDLRG
jgi:L-amino acid N-acyltransferase YncA